MRSPTYIEAKIAAHPKWGNIWDWVRFIDDTLSAWESEDIFQEFFEFLNSLHHSIKWTCETEKDKRLQFLTFELSELTPATQQQFTENQQPQTDIFITHLHKRGKKKHQLSEH